jgi:hypothetical protein
MLIMLRWSSASHCRTQVTSNVRHHTKPFARNMPSFIFTTLATDAERPAKASAAAEIINQIADRPAWDSLQIRPEGTDMFPFMNISRHAGYGLEVQCFSTPDSNSDFLASDKVLSAPEVYVELGGQTQELWPKQLFVTQVVAIEALKYFLESGRENPKLIWVPIAQFPRCTVPPRRPPP